MSDIYLESKVLCLPCKGVDIGTLAGDVATDATNIPWRAQILVSLLVVTS